MAQKIVSRHPLRLFDKSLDIDEEIFMRFQSITLGHEIKCWLLYDRDDITADQAFKFYEFFMSHSLLEIL